MTTRCAAGIATLLLATAVVGSLSGCRTEYRGHESGIDGVLWRQLASVEDPFSREVFDSLARSPIGYLDALDGARWSGTAAAAADLDLRNGGVVLYEISSTESMAEFSVFIASGPRPEVATDDGRQYSGPSAVFTCFGVRADPGPDLEVERTEFDECPAALVAQLPDDAAFAGIEVFDG